MASLSLDVQYVCPSVYSSHRCSVNVEGSGVCDRVLDVCEINFSSAALGRSVCKL